MKTKSDHFSNPATYSAIIDAEAFNKIMDRHLYMAQVDQTIQDVIVEKITNGAREIVEVGCGPRSQMLRLLARISAMSVNAILMDHDEAYIQHTKILADKLGFKGQVRCDNVESFTLQTPADLIVSHGMHHHINKGETLKRYLKNIYQNLTPQGFYVLSDEFLPNYESDAERHIKTTIWHFTVISHALKQQLTELAVEEAKTLLDDLCQGSEVNNIKTEEQINLVLSYVHKMDDYNAKSLIAHDLASDFLEELSRINNFTMSGIPAMDLSRGDYKICDLVFINELASSGFRVATRIPIGLVDETGGMAVYILSK